MGALIAKCAISKVFEVMPSLEGDPLGFTVRGTFRCMFPVRIDVAAPALVGGERFGRTFKLICCFLVGR